MSVSKRANALMNQPSAIVEGIIQCAEDPFNEKNPNGYLNFGVAENTLMDDYILKKMNTQFELESKHIHYSGMDVEELRRSFTQFAQNYLDIIDLNPEHVVVQAGVSAICEALSFSLFDEGDVIMLASPYYTGFEHDFLKRFKCEFLNVPLDPSNNLEHTIEVFQETYHHYPHKEKVKAVLICHPHNPTGEILQKSFMIELIDFVKENELELLSDEIYALSTHWKEKHISLYQEARNRGAKAHLLYGMAKDFAIAGFKTGFFYSENVELVQAMKSLQYFYPVSSLTQVAVTNLLKDKTFLNSYIELNQERLNKTKRDLTSSLSHFDFIEAGAGLFVLLNLSHWCETFEDEIDLHHQMLHNLKINVIKGKDLGMKTPGFFRICFARSEREIREFCKRMNTLKRTNI